MIGLAGTDILNGGRDNDTLNGGAGIDTADYSDITIGGTTFTGATAGVTVNLNLAGTAFNDTLIGNSANNVLLGGWNNDRLDGGGGTDTLTGGRGDDELDGGDGNDTADYSTATAGVTVSFDETDPVEPQNTGGAGIDTLLNIENITGSKFDDRLFLGHSHLGTLDGGAGDDELASGNGFVTLIGGKGDDYLDILDGGMLIGGAGQDELVINASSIFTSTCKYNEVDDSPTGAGDKINGFLEELDFGRSKIDLSAIDAIPGGADTPFTWIGNHVLLLAGQAGYVGGVLMANVDGGGVDLEIELVGAPALSVGDIVL